MAGMPKKSAGIASAAHVTFRDLSSRKTLRLRLDVATIVHMRRTIAIIVAAAALLAGAIPSDAAQRRTTTTPLRLATYNIWHDAVAATPDAVAADVLALTKTAKVIGLQESSRAALPLLRRVQKASGYKLYYPADSAIEPILYAPSLERVRARSYLLNEEIVPVDETGARTAKKYLNVLSFTYGGRRIHVGNVHTIVGPNATVQRNALALRQYSGAAAGMSKLRGIRVILGDFNTNPADRLRVIFTGTGYVSTQDAAGWKPTHGVSLLDDILVRGGSRITIDSSETRDGASDHRAFIGAYTVVGPAS